MADRAAVKEFVFDELYILGVGSPDNIKPEDKLADLGVDDLDIMDLVIAFEDEFGGSVSEAQEKQLQAPEATVQGAIDLFFSLLK